jgi:hypothetical protein
MTRGQRGGLRASAYHSYLVRLWQSNEQGAWRASAQCVQSGNTVLFADIDQLLAFLQRHVSRWGENGGNPTLLRADVLPGTDDA